MEASKRFNGKVHVIDSLSAAIGERLLCLYALELVKKGNAADKIVEALEEKKKKLKVIALAWVY